MSGKSIHDANIVATLLVHGVSELLTANPRDFMAFTEIETMDLAETPPKVTV